MPARLKGKDRLEYQKLIEQNAQVYLAKHNAIDQKLQGFWGDSKAFDKMVNEFATAKPELRRLMARELKTLARVAPGDRQSTLNKALSEGTDKAAPSEVASAVSQARRAPFNPSGLAKLRELEESRGRDTMVAYLEARMTSLKDSSSTNGGKQ